MPSSENPDAGGVPRGAQAAAVGVFVAAVVSRVLSSSAEISRLQRANQQLETLLRGRGVDVPVREPTSVVTDGVETVCFLLAVLVLAVVGARFLRAELRMLRQTKASIMRERAEQDDGAPPEDWAFMRDFVYYRLDYWFSSSVYGKPIVLLALTLVLILVGGILSWVVNHDTLGSAFWRSWSYIADSGAHADEVETGARVVALSLTIGGMLVFALVIGLISDGISTKFDQLKAGRAKVVETDHTLILGWSDKTIPLIREIANANESMVKEGSSLGVIVVLAEIPKNQMEQEISTAQVGGSLDLRGSMVVCRTGNPTLLHHLQHVSAETARSIVVLSPVGVNADEADARCLRTVLCLVGLRYSRGHITVEVQDVDNRDLVHIIGGDCVETVVAHDFIGRLIVQSSRQSGLAQILEHILGFEGNEFYMQHHDNQLVGRTFAEVLFMFEHAIPLGIRTAEPNYEATERGEWLDPHAKLNPPDDYVIKKGDRIIVLAEDDDTYEPAAKPLVLYPPPGYRKGQARRPKEPPPPEKVLLVGWRRDLGDMLKELDQVVGKGSQLCLFNTVPLEQREEKLSTNGRDAHHKLANLTLRHAEGNPIVRRELERLPIEDFQSIFILADEEYEADMEQADGRSLTSLLLIHDIRRQRTVDGPRSPLSPRRLSPSQRLSGRSNLALVSEVLDPRTRQIIQLAHVSDYVMSNEMVSAALAMVAECREVNSILQEVLSSEGNEIYVPEAREFIDTPQELSFFDLMSICRCHGVILIGYAERGSPPVINPVAKNSKKTWKSHDKLVVLAED